MSGRANASPVIIKRKKAVDGGGHHGGAWKVAYADFVTAMMAFFMLMWLLNATTEKQRKGIADYFSPTIPLSRISGGGDGSFGGESVFSEDEIAQNGTGASSLKPTQEIQSVGQTGTDISAEPVDQDQFSGQAKSIEDLLMGTGGESLVSENAARHILTKLTDEGLVVEIFDIEGDPLFEKDKDVPTLIARELADAVARAFSIVPNGVVVKGRVQSYPEVLLENPVWPLSIGRAAQMRILLEEFGLDPGRVKRVSGLADRKPEFRNPMAVGNNRLEIVLLRSDQE